MAHLHLVIGPVGAGKSTFLCELCREHRAVGLNLDAWMAVLFGADPRPEVGRVEWYLERRDRCLDQIWHVTEDMLEVGTNAVLEVGLIRRADRAAFYARADRARHPMTIYVLDAPREERWARVEQRNADKRGTYSMDVPRVFFDLASDLWEPPDDDERATRDLRFVTDATDQGGALTWWYER